MQSDSTTTDAFVANHACVVYDSDTGEVLHIHEVTCLEGGYVPTESELEERTLELARTSLGAAARKVQTLVVDPVTVADGASFRVDADTKRIVRIEK